MSNDPLSIKVGGAEARVYTDADPVELSCGSAGCESNCCTRSAPVILNPYEIALICRESGMSYETLLDVVDTGRTKSFPLVMLPRDPACHFWSSGGCRIYSARPLACRLYPLGRVFENGKSYIVHPELNVCGGFVTATARQRLEGYLAGQSVDLHIRMSDIWIDFVSEIERLPLPDAPVTSVAFHMLVYSPDTPPARGHTDSALSPEDRFMLRLKTAREQLPRFLHLV